MTDLTLFIGLDVHKKTIAVALADAVAGSEVRFHGTIANTPDQNPATYRPDLASTLTNLGNVYGNTKRFGYMHARKDGGQVAVCHGLSYLFSMWLRPSGFIGIDRPLQHLDQEQAFPLGDLTTMK